MSTLAPRIFISYSPANEYWKDRVLDLLWGFHDAGEISLWHDRQIEFGDEWYPAIRRGMEQAVMAICLISEHFLNSELCTREEVPRLIERRSTSVASDMAISVGGRFTKQEALETLVNALCTLPGKPKLPVAAHVLPLFRQRPGAEILADRIEAYMDTSKPRPFSLREIRCFINGPLCNKPVERCPSGDVTNAFVSR